MNDWIDSTRNQYAEKGLGARVGWGSHPALIIVDMANAFTDPSTGLGSDMAPELEAINTLLAEFRAQSLPVIYMTVAYKPDYSDAATFITKVPALEVLVEGTKMVEIDDRIKPLPNEPVVVKKFGSAFFGTDVDERLKAANVDTAVVVGCSTSGCVRATVIDAMQNGYRTIVVEDGTADRAEGPHRANLFDMDSKYADVVSLDSALESLKALA